MSCEEAKERLARLAQGELGGEEARILHEHLAVCASCFAETKVMELVELLPAVDPEIEPSEDFHRRFLLRLRSHRAQSGAMAMSRSWRVGFRNWRWMHKLAAAGALAAVLGFGIYVGVQRPEEPITGPVIMREITMAENLPLLRDMRVIENLDLLEDFDAIQTMAEGKDASSVH